MVALTRQEQQVVELFRRLDPGRRRIVLLELVRANAEAWKRYREQGESRLRALARDRGLDWDAMDEQSRQDFVEDVMDGEAA